MHGLYLRLIRAPEFGQKSRRGRFWKHNIYHRMLLACFIQFKNIPPSRKNSQFLLKATRPNLQNTPFSYQITQLPVTAINCATHLTLAPQLLTLFYCGIFPINRFDGIYYWHCVDRFVNNYRLSFTFFPNGLALTVRQCFVVHYFISL